MAVSPLTRFLLINDKKNSGFTLIELLVVIVIGGILAAIALPFFLSRASAAKQTEAKTFLGVLNRAQQAFYTQHSQFSDDLKTLVLNTDDRPYYQYSITVNNQGLAYAVHNANPRIDKVRAYVSMSAIVQDQAGNVSFQTIVCESDTLTQNPAPPPMHNANALECAPGTNYLD